MRREPDASCPGSRCVSRDVRRLIVCALALAVGATSLAAPSAAGPPADVRDPLLALSCGAVTAADVRDVLSHTQAPRVILISGSLPLITMDSFARFLAA